MYYSSVLQPPTPPVHLTHVLHPLNTHTQELQPCAHMYYSSVLQPSTPPVHLTHVLHPLNTHTQELQPRTPATCANMYSSSVLQPCNHCTTYMNYSRVSPQCATYRELMLDRRELQVVVVPASP